MPTLNVFTDMKKTAARYPNELAAARTRQPILAPFETAAALLAALGKASSVSGKTRGAITAALVMEQQRRPHPLWQALLLIAFEPMLRKLRTRLGNKKDEDLDQQVLLAFLEGVHALPVAETLGYTPLALRWATEKAVLAERCLAADLEATATFDKETEGWEPFGVGAEEPAVDGAVAEVTRLIEAGGDNEELLRVVLATCAGDDSLSEYVARAYAALSPVERTNVCGRLRRERAQVLDRLRTRFAAHQKAA